MLTAITMAMAATTATATDPTTTLCTQTQTHQSPRPFRPVSWPVLPPIDDGRLTIDG